MGVVVIATQEKAVEVAAFMQLRQGRYKSMWRKLPVMKVAVVGMGYALVAVDTGIDY